MRGRGQFRPREPQGSSASWQGRTDKSREQDRGGGLKGLLGYSQQIPSQSLQEEATNTADTVALDFRPPELGDSNFLLFKLPYCGTC